MCWHCRLLLFDSYKFLLFFNQALLLWGEIALHPILTPPGPRVCSLSGLFPVQSQDSLVNQLSWSPCVHAREKQRPSAASFICRALKEKREHLAVQHPVEFPTDPVVSPFPPVLQNYTCAETGAPSKSELQFWFILLNVLKWNIHVRDQKTIQARLRELQISDNPNSLY